ncbi:Minf_1886 family protein [Botrimarina sp.]|uniref:Minf_1886 family protein n=1 Tax=Botrimarina sp. TaxID=2795802 RepID=UPI0032EE8FFF
MLDPKHPLAELLRRDRRYDFDAYVFVFDALRYGQEKLGLGAAIETDEPLDPDVPEDEEERHVTGPELCRAIQSYAIRQYGLLARSVLAHWGVRTTGDFGEIVFNLIDIGQMRKTDNDRREDFNDVYDFGEAFAGREVFSATHVSCDDADDA